jgi:thymidylate kinase
MTGKFIVLYGSNNIGKSTQTQLLQQRTQNSIAIKYPIYESPTGALISQILRSPELIDRKYTEIEIQQLYVQDRQNYEPKLMAMLKSGTSVIAEDYIGTGIAWGMTRGLNLESLISMNEGLLQPDITILLDADYRYTESIEKTHKNENDDQLWIKNRDIYRLLAKKFNWNIINANQPQKIVSEAILNLIKNEV